MKKFNFKMLCTILAVLVISTSSSWGQITTFDYTGSLQTYTVPVDVTSIQIMAVGAQGGNDGGMGASMQGDFDVTPGEVLTLLVGEQGFMASNILVGGGGGSFVVDAADEPMIIAGGGGGRSWDGAGTPTSPNIDANTGENGFNGYSEENGLGGATLRHGIGGIDGNGSTLFGPHGNAHAGNGGGFYTNGVDGLCGGAGASFLTGGAGGTGCISVSNGGYGGGGCGGNSGSGGGGGYSGGGGSYHNPTNGGGAGSYNEGTFQDNVAGVGSGNGQIIITVLCHAIEVEVSDEEICLGESFTLDASGDGTITWDGGVENGEAFTPEATGIVTYTATSDSDEDCDFSIDIEVIELPVVTASVDESEICIGESIILTGGGADDYEWFPMVIEDGVAYTPESGEYTYSVIGTDDGTGCENVAEVDVSVYDLPEVIATVSDEEICLGESVTLNGEGATSYVWDAEEDGVEFTPDATGTTTYTVEGTDDNDCMNEDVVDITVYEELEITYTTTDEILGGDGEINITVTGGNPAYTFDWDNDGTGDFDDDEDLTGLTGGNYTVVVMCDAGCSVTETVTLDSQVGINELNGLSASVYPNPTSDVVTITLEGNFNYKLTTINGEIVLKGNGFNSQEILMNTLADGIYILNIFTDEQSTVIKLVKE